MDVAIGQRSGRLVVVGFVGRGRHGLLCFCQCDCGGVKPAVREDHFKSGHTRSCGCLGLEILLKHGHGSKGARRSPTYRSWCAMTERCTNPKASSFAHYGGRGIAVCPRWQGGRGFENFLSDMGERPAGTSIDRIDVNGNYTPENCRWADAKTQRANQRARGKYRPRRKHNPEAAIEGPAVLTQAA
jgi:hypothetical protein